MAHRKKSVSPPITFAQIEYLLLFDQQWLVRHEQLKCWNVLSVIGMRYGFISPRKGKQIYIYERLSFCWPAVESCFNSYDLPLQVSLFGNANFAHKRMQKEVLRLGWTNKAGLKKVCGRLCEIWKETADYSSRRMFHIFQMMINIFPHCKLL